MKHFEKEAWYSISYPDDWTVDPEEDPPVIYHPDGVGVLHVTNQTAIDHKEGERIDPYLMLRAFLRQTGVDVDGVVTIRGVDNGAEWAETEHVEESPEEGEVFWRSWFFTNQEIIVFLTYACKVDDKELEKKAVDQIVGSLVLKGIDD